jgi:ABC-type uncharacterized transport system involved in gliding motility auxiliary subunit
VALMSGPERTKVQRYAFIGLVVASLACISAAFTGLLIGFVKLQIFSVSDLGKWQTAAWVSLAFSVIGLAAFGIMDPDRVRRFLTGRQARYGSNSLIMTVAVVGILFVANMLAFQNPQTIDFTEDKAHTLAPETVQALGTLPDKVTAVAFFSQRADRSSATELLQNFKVNSGGKFDYHFIDPDSDPVAARQAGITGDGKIMLVMGTNKEIASYADETELTRSLIRLISPEKRVIYFLTGHGEPDTANAAETSMTVAKSTLEGKNYTVNTLNLLAENKIPEDALSIVVAGPLKPLSAQEVDLLKKYVEGGGGLVVMEDPAPLTEFGDAQDPLAAYLASDWGIQLDNDIVIDLTNSGNELYATSSSLSSSHAITQSMTLAAILPRARSLSVGKAPEGVQNTPLAQTTNQSWGETDFESLSGEVKYDEGADLAGPLTLATAGENTTTKGRVVVFGDTPFATDQFFDAYGNGDLFVNAVDWTAAQEDLIQITPHQPVERTFNVPSQVQWLMILLGSVFILPGLVLVAGISSWLSRRRRG